MQKTKEILFQSIGEVTSKNINSAWNKAWVTIDVLEDGAFEMECEYEAVSENMKKTFKGGLSLFDLLLELRRVMEEEGSGLWRKATLELSTSGKFDLEFEY